MPAFFLFFFVLFVFLAVFFVFVVIEVFVVLVFFLFGLEFNGVNAGDGQGRTALVAGQDIALIQFFFFDVNGGVTLGTSDHIILF